MHKKRPTKKLTLARDESGATAIFFALTLSILCGFVALAFDIGHLFMVRAELQRTADAGALAGVTGFIPYTGSLQTPNWANGVTKAHTMISNAANKADNLQFTTAEGTVDYGYWLLNPPAGYVQTLPKARPTTAAYLPEPAIKVTLSRNVTLSFAPVIGVSNPRTVLATATAILPEGYSIAPGKTFAMAVEESIVFNDGTINLSPQDFGWGDHGQWYNLDGSNNVPTIRRNDQINAHQNIYIAPGAKETLYDPSIVGQVIFVPVVESVETKQWQKIRGFAAFEVTGIGSKSIDGHFLSHYIDPGAIPGTGVGGTYYGFSGTPKLVGP
jgi:Flp pilus assembly protein TadG